MVLLSTKSTKIVNQTEYILCRMIVVFDSCLVVEESHVIVLLNTFSFIIQDAQLYVRTAISLKLEMKKKVSLL